MDFDEYVQQAILEPAGLEDTYFPGNPFDPARLARTYLGSGDRALPQETLGVHGTGGIYATASDLAAFGGLFWRHAAAGPGVSGRHGRAGVCRGPVA